MKIMVFLVAAMGLFAAFLTGCAGPTITKTEVIRPVSPVSLDTWLEEAAFPEIIKQLRTNSFLKARPFMVARAKGESVGTDISNQIDFLTEGVREELVSRLLEYPDIAIVRRHPVPALERPYRLREIKCGDFLAPEMLLVFDTTRSGELEDRVARVSIRAIDLKRDNWIPGFSLHREVSLTPAQSRDLNSLHADEYLRGTKYVPFLESQGAEMAAYLAGNLSCIFRETSNGKEVRVFVDGSRVKRRDRDIAWFLKKQLQRCNEIQLTKADDQSDWVLVPEARETGPGTGIGQFWVDVYKRSGGELVKGLATYANFVMGKKRPVSLIGRWEILTLPAGTQEGFLEITGGANTKYRGDLFGADGITLRVRGISIAVNGNDIEWTYYDDEMRKTVVVKGLLGGERERMAVKVRTFPATDPPFSQELELVD